MTGEPRAIEPLGFFTLESLKAGWYLAWRLVVFTLPITLVAMVGAGLVGASGRWLAAMLVVLGGVVVAVAVVVEITNRVAGAWAFREYGRPLPAGVGWPVTWRVLVVGVPLSLLLTPLSLFAQGPLFIGNVLDLVLPAVGLLLAAFFVVATLQSYGWALSTAVADRLGGAGGLDGEPDELDELGPARVRALLPRPASAPRRARPTRPVAAPDDPGREQRDAGRESPAATRAGATSPRRCPKCGLRETERGSVIGWYCRVCGWREKRA